MKNILVTGLCCIVLLSACGTLRKVNTTDNFLPPGFENLEFGMSLSTVTNLRPSLEDSGPEFDFREVYIEEKPTTAVNTAVYYFDAEGEKPFYELIVEYPDMASRDKVAADLFGPPNMGGEWYFDEKPYPIKAWVFKNKLVIAALIPDTEWYEEAQKGVDDWK